MIPPPRRDNMESFWLVREALKRTQTKQTFRELMLLLQTGRDTEASISSILTDGLPPAP